MESNSVCNHTNDFYKIGRPRSGSPICLITSMITDRIGRHEVLLPINHNSNKICDIYTVFTNGGHAGKKWCLVMKARRWRINKLLFAAVLRIAANYCFHGSSLLTAVMETHV